jgi:hypothetical protein
LRKGLALPNTLNYHKFHCDFRRRGFLWPLSISTISDPLSSKVLKGKTLVVTLWRTRATDP